MKLTESATTGIKIPAFAVGDVDVALVAVEAAVAVAFMNYVIGNGKVKDLVAVKIPKPNQTPATKTSSKEDAQTTEYDDIADSVFTHAPALYEVSNSTFAISYSRSLIAFLPSKGLL